MVETGGVDVVDGLLFEGNQVLVVVAVVTSLVFSLSESLKRTDLPETRRAAIGPLIASADSVGSSLATLLAVTG